MPQLLAEFYSYLCFFLLAFIKQYSLMQIPVAGVNGKEWQEREVGKLFFGSSWWLCWLKVVMEQELMVLGTQRF